MLDFKDKLIATLVGVLVLVILVGVVGYSIQKRSMEKNRVALLNQLADKDKTIEEQKGLYTKLTMTSNDTKTALDSTSKQNQELLQQIKTEHSKLLDATELSITWKHNYESAVSASQTVVTTQAGKTRDRVDFTHDFGYIYVSGYTLTSPPEGWVSLKQNHPIKITVALAQEKDGSWRSYGTSSEDNLQLNIDVSSVNPYLLETKWYEKLALRGNLGLGTTDKGLGLLVGIGATMEFGRFDVGPAGFLMISDHVDKYLGIMVGYHPFQSK